MAISKDAIRKALETLSHVSKEDYEGMEAEFFATVAKLSNEYESHVKYSIAKNYIEDFLTENFPPCPSCGKKSEVIIACPILDLRFITPYLNKKDETIYLNTDISDSYSVKKFPSNQLSKFYKIIESAFPKEIYLLDDHMYCSSCKISFPPNDFIKNIWKNKIVFADIVEWSKNKIQKL